jgi:hypothetical protein
MTEGIDKSNSAAGREILREHVFDEGCLSGPSCANDVEMLPARTIVECQKLAVVRSDDKLAM